MRDHIPDNWMPYLTDFSHLDEPAGDGSPPWADILNAEESLVGQVRQLTMTVAGEIPPTAFDMLYVWPTTTTNFEVADIPMVYLGPHGWEVAIDTPQLGYLAPTELTDIRSARIERTPSGFVRFELRAYQPAFRGEIYRSGAASNQTDYSWWRPVFRFYMDADNNPATGSGSGAETAVQLMYDPWTSAVEARVLRWNGTDWAVTVALPTPEVSADKQRSRWPWWGRAASAWGSTRLVGDRERVEGAGAGPLDQQPPDLGAGRRRRARGACLLDHPHRNRALLRRRPAPARRYRPARRCPPSCSTAWRTPAALPWPAPSSWWNS